MSIPEKAILDNLNISVLLFDQQLKLLYINLAGEMLFAGSARQLLGLSIKELILFPQGNVEIALIQAMENAYPFTEREMLLPLPDGQIITVNCTLTPIYESDNQEILVELQQVDRQLRISREQQLVTQHQATRALVKGMAHEIKNPLGGIRGAAQLLSAELKHSTELQEYTQIIIQEVDRLKVLVDRMLGPNKLPSRAKINIHSVLERVRLLVTVEAESKKQITIIRDYDPSIPEFYADADQLMQALLNIVSNAIQSLQQTGSIILKTRIQRQLTIAHKKHKLAVKIDIIDNGSGISKEMQKTIFYPMITSKAEGTGLGLSIAQSLVNQHQGLIECDSQPGETTFTILLPLKGIANAS